MKLLLKRSSIAVLSAAGAFALFTAVVPMSAQAVSCTEDCAGAPTESAVSTTVEPLESSSDSKEGGSSSSSPEASESSSDSTEGATH